jgi:signal transduction histidine kinase
VSLERLAEQLRPYRWEIAWGVWAVANLTWMEMMPEWVSVPFHFIWVSFTVLYGFRAWRNGITWALVGFVVGSTGIVLGQLWLDGMPTDEVLEVPLMFGMFLAMMLHTIRRRSAMAEVQRISEENARLLERETAFIQNASHELRTPITVALAHAELVRTTIGDRGKIPQNISEDVDIVIDELDRLRGLTSRLLLLAAVDRPELVRSVPTDLVGLLDAAVHRWSAIPRTWRIVRREEAIVLADPERLTVALDTVVENAVKVTTTDDPIELSVTRDGRFALVEIADCGPGIDPQLLHEVFDRFTTVGRQPGSAAGFGLGLAIVDAIATAHGGTVTARNRPAGGASFTVRLPLAPERDVEHGMKPSASARPASARVHRPGRERAETEPSPLIPTSKSQTAEELA